MNRSLTLCALVLVSACALLVASISLLATPSTLAYTTDGRDPVCTSKSLVCTETRFHKDYEGNYVGHDEPSLLFYSTQSGAGNSNVYQLTLPKDPPTKPKQDGSGGTWNFQLHPAFWFGMAMCDSESFPEFTHTCTADSDANIFNSGSPVAADFIGHHPGAAFMEMQFYPPGWAPWPAGVSCDATKWCAALNIDSLIVNGATSQPNNTACRHLVGDETVNFAFITKNGTSHAAADPVTGATNPAQFTPNSSLDFFMDSGDQLVVDMHDTANGLTISINDITSGHTGSMTASIANGFGQIKFDPGGSGCTVLPYDFHPMYASSTKDTRVPWAAHSYNIAFSDEIGHFEYCAKANNKGKCTSGGDSDKDDTFCLNKSASLLIKIGGCLGTDTDWDGPTYFLNWPGTLTPPHKDHTLHPDPIIFTSPVFLHTSISTNYDKVAFETDLPGLEESFGTNACSTLTGKNCTNPPTGAKFYPMYTTKNEDQQCVWQLGGIHIPGTTNTFGGTPLAEYGKTFGLLYQTGPSSAHKFFEDFRKILKNNPCPVILP